MELLKKLSTETINVKHPRNKGFSNVFIYDFLKGNYDFRIFQKCSNLSKNNVYSFHLQRNASFDQESKRTFCSPITQYYSCLISKWQTLFQFCYDFCSKNPILNIYLVCTYLTVKKRQDIFHHVLLACRSVSFQKFRVEIKKKNHIFRNIVLISFSTLCPQ